MKFEILLLMYSLSVLYNDVWELSIAAQAVFVFTIQRIKLLLYDYKSMHKKYILKSHGESEIFVIIIDVKTFFL